MGNLWHPELKSFHGLLCKYVALKPCLRNIDFKYEEVNLIYNRFEMKKKKKKEKKGKLWNDANANNHQLQ